MCSVVAAAVVVVVVVVVAVVLVAAKVVVSALARPPVAALHVAVVVAAVAVAPSLLPEASHTPHRDKSKRTRWWRRSKIVPPARLPLARLQPALKHESVKCLDCDILESERVSVPSDESE